MPPVQAVAKKRSIKRWILPVAALLLAGAVVAPPLVSLNRVHRRIADSISQAVGRPVRMSSITLRLLPRPAFEIADFVVDDDPAFGVEPILRSSEVVASVRLLPLWRGRLEIARIAFDEPSLNLVRNREGRWNFDSLLSQAAQIRKAPTGELHPRGLQRFPYIDANNARVNFKSGDEKLPFSFFNADLAVWLQNPDEWRIQFAAQPVRTDLSLDLANTGTFRLNGSLGHAATLSRMPMNLHVEWSNAPLGQLSKILTGSDADWRGQLDAAADITGTLEHSHVKFTASGQSVHRVEFDPREPLDVIVTCKADFSRAGRLFDAVTCLVPTGSGHLLLTGAVHAVPTKPDPDLRLEMNTVPAAWALDCVRLFRAGFGNALTATGTIDGNFTYTSASTKPMVSSNTELLGQATINNLTIAGPAFQKPFALPVLRLTMGAQTSSPTRRGGPSPKANANELVLAPFVIGSAPAAPLATPAVGIPQSLTVSGAFAWNGFNVHLGGESHIGELIALGKEFGLVQRLPVDFGGQGVADLDLAVHGPWMLPVSDQPVVPAAVDGTLRLRNAQISGDFLAQPLHVPAAQAVFAGNEITWTTPGMVYGPLRADGTLIYPAFCMAPTGCVPRFNLHLASLDAETAQSALLGAQHHGELVERLLDRLRSLNETSPSWPSLTGILQIGALTVQSLTAKDFTAEVAVHGHAVELKSSTARALDGQLHLTGSLEVADHTPHYQIVADLDDASARSTAALFAENWGPGSVNLSATLRFSGFEQREILASAAGTFHWEWLNGGLPAGPSVNGKNAANAPGALCRFDTWTADGIIANGALSLQKSQVIRGADAIPLTGTISFGRELNLSGGGNTHPFKISGSLQRPLTQTGPTTTASSTTP